MGAKEKEIIKKIAEIVPSMSDMDKGYLLGTAEQMIRGGGDSDE